MQKPIVPVVVVIAVNRSSRTHSPCASVMHIASVAAVEPMPIVSRSVMIVVLTICTERVTEQVARRPFAQLQKVVHRTLHRKDLSVRAELLNKSSSVYRKYTSKYRRIQFDFLRMSLVGGSEGRLCIEYIQYYLSTNRNLRLLRSTLLSFLNIGPLCIRRHPLRNIKMRLFINIRTAIYTYATETSGDQQHLHVSFSRIPCHEISYTISFSYRYSSH